MPIDYCVPSACPHLIVVPDTARMRDRVRDLLAGRLDPFPIPRADVLEALKAAMADEVPPYDPPADFLRFPVVRAECSVSGVLREGQWGDAAGLEAARMLLLSRFDLKLGLWDLALNPVLRSPYLTHCLFRVCQKRRRRLPLSRGNKLREGLRRRQHDGILRGVRSVRSTLLFYRYSHRSDGVFIRFPPSLNR
jgi:hypothetical protein